MNEKTLWELLWDYDPNGLVAVGPDMNVRVVNEAFCRMFRVGKADILGKPVTTVLSAYDAQELRAAMESDGAVPSSESAYPELDLFVRKVIFTIRSQDLAACILVDLTNEWRQRNELAVLRKETIDQVNRVIGNQMKVAQEIARLLGETTAQSKISLLRLVDTVRQETV
jgi:PAS domain-containing protein